MADYKYGAVSIFFSTDKFDQISDENKAIVNNFFSNILSNEKSDVNLDGLMEIVDWNNRWIYKGSMTTPPCEQFVYWNIIKKVYPISQ